MKKVLKLSAIDYKRRWNKPTLVLIHILSPVLLTLIMWFALGGGGSGSGFSPVKLAIVNRDKGKLISDFLEGAFSNDNAKKYMDASSVSYDEAIKLINTRKVSAVIIIPEKFTEKLIKREKTDIRLIKNPTEVIYPMIAETGLNILKDGTNYILTIFGDEIETIRKAVVNKKKIDSDMLKNLYDSIEPKIKKIIPLFKDKKIEIKELTEKKKKASFVIYIFAGMSFFFLFFISNAILSDMVKERNKFIIKRLFLSELKKSEYFFSRILSSIVFVFTIEIILAVTGRLLFNLKTDSIFWLLITLIVSSLTLTMLSATIMGLSNNERQVNTLGMIFVFVFAILGGSLIPVSVLPPALSKFSVISPLFYITETVISLVVGNMERFYRMISIAFGISLFLLFLSYLLNIRALKKVVK